MLRLTSLITKHIGGFRARVWQKSAGYNVLLAQKISVNVKSLYYEFSLLVIVKPYI